MTCPRLPEVLAENPTADALAHAQTCPTCSATLPVPSSLADAARAELRAKPNARQWWWDVVVLLGLDVAVAGIALAMVNLAQASHADQGLAAALVLLMVLGTWAAIAPRAHVLRYAVVALAGLAAVWTGFGGSGMPTAVGPGCAMAELGLSAVPLAVVVLITSRFAWDPWRALAGGLSVGATGIFVLHLHCSNGSASHLLGFHVAPWLVIASAAVGLRRAWPTRSFAS